MNIVELVAGEDEQGYDQPCRHGNRVDGHAVYCHNNTWAEAPRKCRRTWYYGRDAGAEKQDEACPGFSPNPGYNKETK